MPTAPRGSPPPQNDPWGIKPKTFGLITPALVFRRFVNGTALLHALSSASLEAQMLPASRDLLDPTPTLSGKKQSSGKWPYRMSTD
ncbi:hypothetical protein L596_029231 [Steinernema carpocapsae]|uniref:Uncharacterized protein n=1 Tax=Steinernema carpocapsae TaxID=34508 RepID=A0A4U5LU08_STECR|nr:hypothetical protein L596_029231 [Steinernema carpocapsae]